MHVIIISTKRGHEFEGKWDGVHGRTFSKEREKRNAITMK